MQCAPGAVLHAGFCYAECDAAGGFAPAATAAGDVLLPALPAMHCVPPAQPSLRFAGARAAAAVDVELGFRQNTLQLRFRTRAPCGQLLFTGPELANASDFVAATVDGGNLYVSAALGGVANTTSSTALLGQPRFDDGFWHSLVIMRTDGRVSVDVRCTGIVSS
jgi:hypothetical protein